MKRAIGKHLKDFIAVVLLFVVAGAVSYGILQNQRLRIPYLEPSPHKLYAEFSTAQAVIAGQGQTIQVSGVRVGDIGKVELKEGKAVVEMLLDEEFKDLVRSDASALLRPKTGLKDMFIDLNPGSEDAPLVKEGFTIPIAATQPDVNPDEVLGILDSDTRDYLKLLVNGAGKGLKGRGNDLQEVFARFEPTHRDLARVNSQVALRRKNLRRLIHSLRLLNTELAEAPEDISTLIGSSQRVLSAFAQEESAISAAVRNLPGALSQTTDTLTSVEAMARILGPAAESLRPVAARLEGANEATRELANEITPVLQKDIRPFVRAARPVLRDIKSPAADLAKATPDLTGTFKRLNTLFNLIGFNPGGAEAPSIGARQEGYLFWIAWVNHMALNLFSTSDAHGTFRPTTVGAPCATITQLVDGRPELEFLQSLTPLLVDSAACQATGTP